MDKQTKHRREMRMAFNELVNPQSPEPATHAPLAPDLAEAVEWLEEYATAVDNLDSTREGKLAPYLYTLLRHIHAQHPGLTEADLAKVIADVSYDIGAAAEAGEDTLELTVGEAEILLTAAHAPKPTEGQREAVKSVHESAVFPMPPDGDGQTVEISLASWRKMCAAFPAVFGGGE